LLSRLYSKYLFIILRNVSQDKISLGKQSISKFKFQRKTSLNSTKENENSTSQTGSSSSKSNVTAINIPSNNADDGMMVKNYI
jgi:hypothetical protein